jgi:hypothetical protein
MTTNSPPSPNVNTFNNSYWTSSSDTITQAQADLRYLKYPIAQGDETLKNIKVQGNTTTTNGGNSLILNANATASQYGPSVQEGDQVLVATGTINSEALTITTHQSTGLTHIRLKNNDLIVRASNALTLTGSNSIEVNTLNFNVSAPIYNRGIFNCMNTANNNRLLMNSNPSISQYNPCVTSTSQQVIAATGTIDTETLVLTTEASTSNGIVIGSNTVNFPSTSAPTSNQTLLASNDNSNKIPTTAWVQSVVGSSAGSVYSQLYYSDQTITTPTNCYAVDILCVGGGGSAGTSTTISGTTYWGGSGSGGNTISCNNIPMSSGESLVLTISGTSSTGSTTLTRNSVTLCRAYNGNAGSNGALNTNAAGGTSNSTIGIGDTSFGAWYNAFGNAGAASSSNGTLLNHL